MEADVAPTPGLIRPGSLAARRVLVLDVFVNPAAAAEWAASGGAYAADVGRLAEDAPWARHLVLGGHAEDLRACLAIDTVRVVPVLLPGVDSLVHAPG